MTEKERKVEARTIKQYYSSMKHFYDVFDHEGRKNPAPDTDLAALQNWQREARQKFLHLLGIDRIPSCSLCPELMEVRNETDYRVERVRIQSAPGLFIPLTILLPNNLKPEEKRPVWMHAFGHGRANRMVDEFITMDNAVERPYEAPYIGAPAMKDLVKLGYIVIAFDSVGSGERLSYPWLDGEIMDIGADNPLNNVLTSLGMSKVGLEVWDLMRVTDYALSRVDCDGRIGVAGTSGGGHQSLFLAAADERVQAAVTSVWFYGFKDAHIGLPHNCSCNYVPGLALEFDCCDIGSMIAPRALQIETGWRDYLSSRKTGLGNVISQFENTRKSYALYGREEKLMLYVFDGGHGCVPWNSEIPGAPQSGGAFLSFAQAQIPLRRDGNE